MPQDKNSYNQRFLSSDMEKLHNRIWVLNLFETFD